MSKNYNLDEETEKFIEDTFKKVIFEDVNKDGSLIHTNYGPISQTYFAPNNEGILWFIKNVFPHVHISLTIVGKGM
jgi:hypothetical protein